jgi:flagellar hook protein FlgE
MMRSLFAGVSGIRNNQTWLDIIGNNISNVNTIGFKGSRATFAEQLAQTLRNATGPHNGQGGTNPLQVGLGMSLASVDTQFQQGALESTGNYTDLAIQGSGFFVVSDGSQKFYTRAGAFTIDADGYLTAQGGGLRVQGYMANQLGTIANNMAPDDIQIPFGMKAPASATTEIGFFCNLDADGTESTATLDTTPPNTAGITNVSGQAVNGAGGVHTLTIGGTLATQGSGNGTVGSLTEQTLLSSLMPTPPPDPDYSNFAITTDTNAPKIITGLSATSTVGDLIDAINTQMSGSTGVQASLNGNGEIMLTRTLYGAGTNISLTGDIATSAFTGFTYAAGSNADLTVTDSFMPTGSTTPLPDVNLQVTIDPNTGLPTGITGLGGGGVTITAPAGSGGLQLGTATINTADTEHSTSIVTYDTLGSQHTVTFNFTKTATPNVWNWEATVEEPAQTTSGNTGTISFNDDGSLQSFTYAGGASAFTFNPGNGAASAVTIALDAGEVGGVDGITQFASPTTTIAQNQDGYGMGNLNNVYIDENGTIIGSFTNDQNLTLAQIVLADFHNPQGLLKAGGNMYKVSANSGDAIYGMSQTDFGSSINSGVVEMSNVELSKEFADMIIAQRGFQASARVITTADQLLQEIVQLKR